MTKTSTKKNHRAGLESFPFSSTLAVIALLLLSTSCEKLREREEGEMKVFMEAVPASSSYSQDKPARFDDDITYYLAREGSPAKEIKLRKKDIEQLLDSKEALDFIKKNKLKLKSEEEVLQLLNHLNGL